MHRLEHKAGTQRCPRQSGSCEGQGGGLQGAELGDPSSWGAADTEHFAAQSQLPEHACPSWGCLGHLHGVRASPGEAPALRSRSPCLGFGCSTAIKGSVGRALAPGPRHLRVLGHPGELLPGTRAGGRGSPMERGLWVSPSPLLPILCPTAPTARDGRG